MAKKNRPRPRPVFSVPTLPKTGDKMCDEAMARVGFSMHIIYVLRGYPIQDQSAFIERFKTEYGGSLQSLTYDVAIGFLTIMHEAMCELRAVAEKYGTAAFEITDTLFGAMGSDTKARQKPN